jgi:putative transposase
MDHAAQKMGKGDTGATGPTRPQGPRGPVRATGASPWKLNSTKLRTVEELGLALRRGGALDNQCLGWHVCEQGTRFAALEPLFQGLMSTVGSVAADVDRGLSLRMDHDTQYLSDHFQNQFKYCGISPSFAFIEQLQTNGVAERFIRTLKEQVIYGRIFNNL